MNVGLKQKIRKIMNKAKKYGITMVAGSTSVTAVFAQTADLSGITQTITDLVPVLVTLAVIGAILSALKKFSKI